MIEYKTFEFVLGAYQSHHEAFSRDARELSLGMEFSIRTEHI